MYTKRLAPYIPTDRPTTVVDAGANIGLASVLYAQIINFNGEIIAIEANPSTLKVCFRTVSLLVSEQFLHMVSCPVKFCAYVEPSHTHVLSCFYCTILVEVRSVTQSL
jgi:hypothetical protein